MDAIMGILQPAMPLIAFIWGLICKYNPKLKNIPNATIPYVNMVLFLLTNLAGPQEAQAASILGIAGHTFFGHILTAAWESVKVSLFYEVFGRSPIGAVLKKP